VFDHVNPEAEKINVLVADLGDYSPFGSQYFAVVDIIDMDDPTRTALYHELSHVLYMRNGVSMGSTLNEGLATYLVNKVNRAKNIPSWNTLYYMEYPMFDETLITGGADGFRHQYDVGDNHYCYGYRFVTFLAQIYGEEIIHELLSAATAGRFDPSYGSNAEADKQADTAHMKRIIISVAGDDVFDRFAAWHQEELPKMIKEYRKYMDSLEKQ